MRLFAMLLALGCALQPLTAGALSLYQVGNSLTWDSQPNSVQTMAQSAGLAWTTGYHIRSNSSLKTIWENPIPSHGLSVPGPTYVEGLANHDWDAIVLQSYGAQGATLGEDIQYAQQFIDHSRSEGRNETSRYYIYTSWASQPTWNHWEASVSNSPSQSTVHRRQYFEHLATALSEAIDAPVHLVPVGDVLFRLKHEIEAGRVPNLTSVSDLYRDNLHMSYDYGRFAAGTTVLATVGGINPTGIPHATLSPETVLRIQEIVWDVVANHPWSGVVTAPGDYDGNGVVDEADYTWWRSNFGKSISYAADGNGDGVINAADYTVWRDNFQAGIGANDAATVPEPGLLLLMGIAAAVTIFQSLRLTRKN